MNSSQLLFTGSDWDFAGLSRVYDAIEEIAAGELGLDIYPNQLEIISAEQMLDAYSSTGMPLMYRHWSFGKHFLHHAQLYRKGLMGLAYEIVINSNPCVVYLMESNTMALQALVIAHAAFGHNHFFKNNHLFRQWTDAEAIMSYMDFAKTYITRCEEQYGTQAVEAVLDGAHALMDQAVFRYRRPPRPSAEKQREGQYEKLKYEEKTYNDLWRTLPAKSPEDDEEADGDIAGRRRSLNLPEENLLYFLEKNSPVLEPWQREILRIVRMVAQYFYPQRQTQVMNEGCATFVHYTIMNTLHDRDRISEGAILEILHNHSNVVFQPSYDDQRYGRINPYALGFDMMRDIWRIATDPTSEDRDWFPDLAGTGDPYAALRDAWANHRDESFILQYLSPELIRKWRFFLLADDARESLYRVEAIHDERGYMKIRSALARRYEIGANSPDIQVVDADLRGDRHLRLEHRVNNGVLLDEGQRDQTLRHISRLWGYKVSIIGMDAETGVMLYEQSSTELGE